MISKLFWNVPLVCSIMFWVWTGLLLGAEQWFSVFLSVVFAVAFSVQFVMIREVQKNVE